MTRQCASVFVCLCLSLRVAEGMMWLSADIRYLVNGGVVSFAGWGRYSQLLQSALNVQPVSKVAKVLSRKTFRLLLVYYI